ATDGRIGRLRLRRARRWLAASSVPYRKVTPEEVHHRLEGIIGRLGVVAWSLVAHEGMFPVGVDVEIERHIGGAKGGVNAVPAFSRDVRVLAAPDEHQRRADL